MLIKAHGLGTGRGRVHVCGRQSRCCVAFGMAGAIARRVAHWLRAYTGHTAWVLTPR